jgi:pimeloyl-ACP methyl ester carboxylesterase
MRLNILYVAVFAALMAVTGLAPQARAEGDALLAFPLEYVLRQWYGPRATPKAMAVAENGAFGFSYGQATGAAAEALALTLCTEKSKFLSLRATSTPVCRIIDSGGKLQSVGFRLDEAWQQAAPGADRPMQKGRKVVVPKNRSKAIILLVHGCNGLGDKVFTDAWGAYFNALGFDLYAPDSFADKRPKEVCGTMSDYPLQQVSDVWRLRVAQTHRTLQELQKKNPDKPIYLWGHSEGGLIVQMITADVAGVIVSGEECGAIGAPAAFGPKVPLLYIWGEFDQYVNGVGYRITKDSTKKCATDYASNKPEFALMEGRSHIPWPWNDAAQKAIAAFLGQTPLKVSAIPTTRKMKKLWKQTKVAKSYRSAKRHRAAAINGAGLSYMVWGLDNEEDATQLALFGCARAISSKTNVFKTGQHLCTVIDVNGKAP